jgi:hypothetical protein
MALVQPKLAAFLGDARREGHEMALYTLQAELTATHSVFHVHLDGWARQAVQAQLDRALQAMVRAQRRVVDDAFQQLDKRLRVAADKSFLNGNLPQPRVQEAADAVFAAFGNTLPVTPPRHLDPGKDPTATRYLQHRAGGIVKRTILEVFPVPGDLECMLDMMQAAVDHRVFRQAELRLLASKLVELATEVYRLDRLDSRLFRARGFETVAEAGGQWASFPGNISLSRLTTQGLLSAATLLAVRYWVQTGMHANWRAVQSALGRDVATTRAPAANAVVAAVVATEQGLQTAAERYRDAGVRGELFFAMERANPNVVADFRTVLAAEHRAGVYTSSNDIRYEDGVATMVWPKVATLDLISRVKVYHGDPTEAARACAFEAMHFGGATAMDDSGQPTLNLAHIVPTNSLPLGHTTACGRFKPHIAPTLLTKCTELDLDHIGVDNFVIGPLGNVACVHVLPPHDDHPLALQAPWVQSHGRPFGAFAEALRQITFAALRTVQLWHLSPLTHEALQAIARLKYFSGLAPLVADHYKFQAGAILLDALLGVSAGVPSMASACDQGTLVPELLEDAVRLMNRALAPDVRLHAMDAVPVKTLLVRAPEPLPLPVPASDTAAAKLLSSMRVSHLLRPVLPSHHVAAAAGTSRGSSAVARLIAGTNPRLIEAIASSLAPIVAHAAPGTRYLAATVVGHEPEDLLQVKVKKEGGDTGPAYQYVALQGPEQVHAWLRGEEPAGTAGTAGAQGAASGSSSSLPTPPRRDDAMSVIHQVVLRVCFQASGHTVVLVVRPTEGKAWWFLAHSPGPEEVARVMTWFAQRVASAWVPITGRQLVLAPMSDVCDAFNPAVAKEPEPALPPNEEDAASPLAALAGLQRLARKYLDRLQMLWLLWFECAVIHWPHLSPFALLVQFSRELKARGITETMYMEDFLEDMVAVLRPTLQLEKQGSAAGVRRVCIGSEAFPGLVLVCPPPAGSSDEDVAAFNLLRLGMVANGLMPHYGMTLTEFQ